MDWLRILINIKKNILIYLILLILICVIFLKIFIDFREKEKFIIYTPFNFGDSYSNLPKFYNNCDGDNKLILELSNGDYTLDDLSKYGFFNSKNGIDCVNVTQGFKIIIYDDDDFQGNKIVLQPSEKNYLFRNDFNLKIRSMKIIILPVFYTKCHRNELLFSLDSGKYTFNDLTKILQGKQLALGSLYIPNGYNVKIFKNDNFTNTYIDVNGPYYSECIKYDNDNRQNISSIIINYL
jgi:hypothetical protein